MQANRFKVVAGLFGALLSGFVVISVASAQLSTADILGTVTDPTGAVVPGAKITVKNLGTGVAATTKSNGTGDYTFNLLPPGSYSITIEASGFKKAVFADVGVAAGDRARENGVLQTGTIEETVQVSSGPPLLQTDSSALTSVVTEHAVQDLPLNGRNFINLVQIQPGITAGQPGAIGSGSRPDDRRQTSVVSANGQSDLFNNEMIDGMDNNEREQGFIGVRPSIDAIAEVEVETNAFSADVGRSAGAVVNIITKSGTNVYHGTAYEFFRNDIFDARDYFTTVASGVAKPEYRQNQFGGSIGGPIVSKRTFFFADAEDFRMIQGQPTGLLTVPTLQERGDLNGTGIYDFSDNGGSPLPAAYVNSVGLAYLKMYPKPNIPGAGLANNFVAAPNETQNSFSIDGRIDQHFKNGDLLFGRYAYNNVNTLVPGALPAVSESGVTIQPGGNLFSYPGDSITKAHNVQFDYVHTLTPNLVIDLKAGYTRIDIDTSSLNEGKNVSSDIGLVNVNTPAAPQTTGLMPVYFLSDGYADLGDSLYLPIIDRNNTFQYMGSLTWTHGAHNIKAGAQFTRRQLNYFQSSYPLGFTLFQGISGNSMEDLLTGLPIGYIRGNTLIQPGYRASELGFYAQDDWRIFRSLTLNLGLRYDVYEPISEAHNRYANFEYDTATNNGAIILGSQDPHIGVNANYTNFAPRVGFSQSIGKETVVRGGYGISYYPLAIQGQIQADNPPYQYAVSCTPCTPAPYNSYIPGAQLFPWPTLPVPTAASTTDLSGSLTYLTKNFNTAYVQQFNLMVQRQLGANVITVGGVGELGRHQLFQPYINIPYPNGPYPNDATSGPDPAPPLLTASTLPNVGQIQADTPWGTSNYYALQAVFARRFTKGLSLNANYTWAHGLSDAVSGSAGGTSTGLIATDPHYDYGNSDVDVRNRFSANWNYKLPFGEQANGGKALLIKGWEWNFIMFWQSGNHFGVVDGFSNNNGLTQMNLPTITGQTGDRPNQLPGVSYRASGGGLQHWLNLAAFTPQPAGTPGDEKNEALTGPNTRRADMSVIKNFTLTEKVSAQFRAECYNISNTPNFSAPNGTVSAWAPGPEHTATTPISAVGLLPGDVPTSAGGFGVISSTTPNVNPRQFQFALKLLF
ncbi:MAG: TonB-dependent receptor [Acidobacteriaceae bacterium]